MNRTRANLFKLGISVAATALLLSLCGAADDDSGPVSNALLTAHNREREREKKAPLKLSPKLSESAASHARDMAKHQNLDHKGSDGSTVAERVKRDGYAYVRVGENIARGQRTVDQVMRVWMHSPTHRANILADYSEMGAARAEDEEGANYWCVNFGIPIPRLKPESAAAGVIAQINRGRKVPLELNLQLARAALAISTAMAAKDKLDTDTDPFQLIDKQALEGRTIRLQLSANVPTPEEAAKELTAQEGKELGDFSEIGVGYAVAKSGTPYWCAIFAKPVVTRRPGGKSK